MNENIDFAFLSNANSSFATSKSIVSSYPNRLKSWIRMKTKINNLYRSGFDVWGLGRHVGASLWKKEETVNRNLCKSSLHDAEKTRSNVNADISREKLHKLFLSPIKSCLLPLTSSFHVISLNTVKQWLSQNVVW